MPQVEMYSIPYCPFCTAAKALLERKGITYTDHDLEALSDRDMRELLVNLCGRTTVPRQSP